MSNKAPKTTISRDPLKQLAEILKSYPKSADRVVVEDFVTVCSSDPNFSKGKLTIGALRRICR